MRVLGETKLGRKEIDDFLNAVLPAAAAVARRTDGAEKSSFCSGDQRVPVTTCSLPKQTCEANEPHLPTDFCLNIKTAACTTVHTHFARLLARSLALTVARSFDMQIPFELPNGGRGLYGRLPMGCSFSDRSTDRHAPHERREAFHKGALP